MLSKKQIKDLETNGYLFLGRIMTESTSKRIYKILKKIKLTQNLLTKDTTY